MKALKSLEPFLSKKVCASAYSLAEPFCPELQNPTLLMRIAQLSSARGGPRGEEAATSAASGASMALVFDTLRVWRLCGEYKPDHVYTLSLITGQENNKKRPAIAHLLFKKDDAIEFALHEKGPALFRLG